MCEATDASSLFNSWLTSGRGDSGGSLDECGEARVDLTKVNDDGLTALTLNTIVAVHTAPAAAGVEFVERKCGGVEARLRRPG
jgi:hypothetical protein